MSRRRKRGSGKRPDLVYLEAFGKFMMAQRLSPDEAREVRRRRHADGSLPVPGILDPTVPLAAALPGLAGIRGATRLGRRARPG